MAKSKKQFTGLAAWLSDGGTDTAFFGVDRDKKPRRFSRKARKRTALEIEKARIAMELRALAYQLDPESYDE